MSLENIKQSPMSLEVMQLLNEKGQEEYISFYTKKKPSLSNDNKITLIGMINSHIEGIIPMDTLMNMFKHDKYLFAIKNATIHFIEKKNWEAVKLLIEIDQTLPEKWLSPEIEYMLKEADQTNLVKLYYKRY